MQAAAALVASQLPCAGRNGAFLADAQFFGGYSDFFAVRRGCAASDDFFRVMSKMGELAFNLELAVHTAAWCAQNKYDLGMWRELSLWGADRNNPLPYFAASQKSNPHFTLFHPMKLGYGANDDYRIAVAVAMRDSSWEKLQ